MAQRTQTTLIIAAALKVNVKTVLAWAAAGCPCIRGARGRSYLFNLQEVESWLQAKGRTGLPGRPVEAGDMADLRKAKLQYTVEKALLTRMKRLEGERKLHDSAECEARIVAQVHATKSELLSLARSVSPELVGKGREEIEKLLAGRIVESLRYFAGQEKA